MKQVAHCTSQLAFIITGDIDAMWLRDSANQLASYKSLLSSNKNQSSPEIASLFRGGINLQGRYIRQSPYCNSFQPPVESGIGPSKRDTVTPTYDPSFVHECKYELDSLAAFLQLSYDYYEQTNDAAFFAQFEWADTVKTIINATQAMMVGTYAADGSINPSPYTWERESDRSTETVANNGVGEPVKGGLGLVRSYFRPSDDSCTFQYFIPGNMMFSRYLKATADIMKGIDANTANEMLSMAAGIQNGIEKNAIITHPTFGRMYAYEIDGYGSYNLMVGFSLLFLPITTLWYIYTHIFLRTIPPPLLTTEHLLTFARMTPMSPLS